MLSRRQLNRATLARQHLLQRVATPVPALLEHLVGLQAQTPHSWYVGLWTRLVSFRPELASELLAERAVVRLALMRSTIHLVTAADCLSLRPLFQPVLERSMKGNFGKQLVGLDRDELAAAGRVLLDQQPLIFSQLGRALGQRWPDRDPASLAQAIRASEALVQVPPRGLWGRSGPAAHTTAENWLGRRPEKGATVDVLLRRYLGAFGPASVKDAQTWSGLTRLSEVAERLREDLVVFHDEDGRELFDLPDSPRPDPDVPAPPRFLYDYDNLLLSHADRTRVITEAAHHQGFTSDGPMPRIVLVDGFTNGTWTIEESRGRATLTIQPFRRLTGVETSDLTTEGAGLLDVVAPKASHGVRFIPPQEMMPPRVT